MTLTKVAYHQPFLHLQVFISEEVQLVHIKKYMAIILSIKISLIILSTKAIQLIILNKKAKHLNILNLKAMHHTI